MSVMPGIIAQDVTVTYRNGNTGLLNANFTIPTGTISALVGINGAGKSTLFKAIMGFLPMQNGSIRILGNSVQAALKKNIVAYVPQSEEVDWTFPVLVKDVVMMGRYGHMNFFGIQKKVTKMQSSTLFRGLTCLSLAQTKLENYLEVNESAFFWREP